MGIELIGAPFDLCGMQLGSRLGPAALRLAGLAADLRELGLDVADAGDIRVDVEPRTDPGGMRNFPPLHEAISALHGAVGSALRRNRLPVVLGGEHTLGIGCVAAALRHFGSDLGVLWIDAHADVNTPGTSETGNIHGMPIAALQGLESGVDDARAGEWRRLLDLVGEPKLPPQNVAWYGLRDVDLSERAATTSGLAITMHHVDRHGVEKTVDRVHEHFVSLGVRNIWVSFDVDALDPILAPGTGTAVRGGLTYREAHLMAELLFERFSSGPYRLSGVDLVETNPLTDSANRTAKMTVEWIASLFGKTILGL